MSSCKTLLAGLLFLLAFIGKVLQAAESLDEVNLAAVEKKPWRFQQFPIMAWWAPPGTATAADFQAYKEAGFTIYCANPDAGFDRALQRAKEAGLPVIAWRERQEFGLAAPNQPVVLPHDDPAIVGWIVADEPSGNARVLEAITGMNRLMHDDPTRYSFFNLLPPHVQKDPDTESIVKAAVRCGMPILSYDNYVINVDGTNRTQEHFDNLERIRKASLEHGVPFWAFALTSKHWHYRRPSESDLRWKQFTNLAYGAKGLWCFVYWGPTEWSDWDRISIVDPANGSKTEVYEYVKRINHSVLVMGDILLQLISDEVVHTAPPQGHRAFQSDRYWISDIAAKEALIGFFHDPAGNRLALVVNLQHGMNKSAQETADDVELSFAPNVQSVTALNWLDGTPGDLALTGRKTVLRISGGTGVLLKAQLAGQR